MKNIVFLDRCMLRHSFRTRIDSGQDLKLFKKRSIITFLFGEDKRVQLYNGVKFVHVTVTREMLGYVLVSFVLQSEWVLKSIKKQKKLLRKINNGSLS